MMLILVGDGRLFAKAQENGLQCGASLTAQIVVCVRNIFEGGAPLKYGFLNFRCKKPGKNHRQEKEEKWAGINGLPGESIWERLGVLAAALELVSRSSTPILVLSRSTMGLTAQGPVASGAYFQNDSHSSPAGAGTPLCSNSIKAPETTLLLLLWRRLGN
ncbi:hypothetical protein Ddc_09326 [Ditylenchus destructor]|nr:hypothetical protein Ddc_09326 [Ditylenchus destructor]